MNPLHSSSLPRTYTLDFRREALRQLGSGQSVDDVARLMGVSKPSLMRWRRQAGLGPASPAIHADPNPRRRAYPLAIRQQALDWLAQGQSVREVADMLGVYPQTVNRWKRQADASSRSSTAWSYLTALDNPSAGADSEGPSSEASLADIGLRGPGPCVTSPAPAADPLVEPTSKLDRRCKYDYQLKQLALDKLRQGQRVSQVAERMGINAVTLYQWQKKAQDAQQPPLNPDADQIRLAQLDQQLQTVSHQRDVLKQALAILLRLEQV